LNLPQFRYTAFGLNIYSEIECEQLLPGEGNCDVHIRLGPVCDSFGDSRCGGVLYQVCDGKFLLKLRGVARYLISEGHEIVVDPAPEADFDSIRLFLLGPAIGALLHQRGLMPFHASAIATPAGAVAFAGRSGSGKSTIANGFYRKGYKILADEVCLIRTGTQNCVIPSHPFLLIWEDALRRDGPPLLNLRRVRPVIEKYILPVGDGFSAEITPLHAMYIIEAAGADFTAPEAISGFPKIGALAENLYQPRFAECMGGETERLRKLAAIASATRIKRINRPRGFIPAERLVALLEEDFKS
jgi:hypothetical protein